MNLTIDTIFVTFSDKKKNSKSRLYGDVLYLE